MSVQIIKARMNQIVCVNLHFLFFCIFRGSCDPSKLFASALFGTQWSNDPSLCLLERTCPEAMIFVRESQKREVGLTCGRGEGDGAGPTGVDRGQGGHSRRRWSGMSFDIHRRTRHGRPLLVSV